MAVKFSQFTTGSTLADIDYFVGYKGTDNIQVAKSLLTGTTYSVDVPVGTTNINLAGSDGSNDAITLTQGSNITLTHVSASEISIAAAAGDTYNLDAATSGSNVNVRLTSGSGTDDSAVLLTAGTGMTITQSGGNNITLASSGGGFGSINQFTGTGSALGALTLGSTPTAAQNCLVSISGVTQNLLDASGVANWTVSSNTLTFTTPPPVTATNGIQIIVIT
tara:strand:+ start:628 stop:1290 length:663 start_codon:yes stop_codon:yes gene_type:complete